MIKAIQRAFFAGSILFSFVCHARDASCPGLENLRDFVKRTPGFEPPAVEKTCSALKASDSKVRVKAIVDLTKRFDYLDDLRRLVGDATLKGLSPEQIEALRMALRSFQYANMFDFEKRTVDATYLAGASVMTIAVLNMHARYIAGTGKPNSWFAEIGKAAPTGRITDSVTFDALRTGNRFIFLDLGMRTLVMSHCGPESLNGLDVAEIIHQTLGAAKYPETEDNERCKRVTKKFADGNTSEWGHDLVHCEQGLAQNTQYSFAMFPRFAGATRTVFSVAAAKVPITVPSRPDLEFKSLADYWADKRAPKPATFAHYNYRVPWLLASLATFREVVKSQATLDIDKLIEDSQRAASVYLAPLLGQKCAPKFPPFEIRARH